MNEPLQISSEQLARYVSGEAEAAERSVVERWASADAANARELEVLRSIWSMGGEPLAAVDVDAAWNKVKGRMHGFQERPKVIPLWRRTAVQWAAAAAVLLGMFVLLWPSSSVDQEVIAYAEARTSTLMDSTRVVVAPGSAVEASMNEQRRIAMHGQVWFEVARDTSRPFIVEAGDLTITVLGTGFEVSAYDSAETWGVRVRHGRVRVEKGTERIELAAGERVLLDRASGMLTRSGPVTTEVWGDRIVQFENAPMSEVITELQRLYHIRVDLSSPAITNCRLTATFETETIDQVLRVISGTFGLQLSRPAVDHYVLEGDGC